MARQPRPGAGPLWSPIPGREQGLYGGDGGFQALESWLYDHDYVDLDRRRISFLAGEPVGVRPQAAARRLMPHTPSGVPGLVRDVGRRHIVISCEYRRVRGDVIVDG